MPNGKKEEKRKTARERERKKTTITTDTGYHAASGCLFNCIMFVPVQFYTCRMLEVPFVHNTYGFIINALSTMALSGMRWMWERIAGEEGSKKSSSEWE